MNPPDQKQDPLIGHVIDGKYEILERIGGGGMGAVYKARHRLMDRVVAVKMIRRSLIEPENDAFRQRFAREARAASRFEHPNAITIHDFGLSDNYPYLVMSFVEGRTLRQALEQCGALPLDQVLHYAEQIGGALDAAHSSGIVHRDLKPDNVMLSTLHDGTEWAQVLDFGIAKLLDSQQAGDITTQTVCGEILGTPQYLSPEQAKSADVDARSDIYAFGIMLYEMLTGEVPFRSDSVAQLLLKHVEEQPTPLRQFKPELEIPECVEKVVLRALEKEPAARYQAIPPLIAELRKAVLEKPKASAVTGAVQQASAAKQIPVSVKTDAGRGPRWQVLVGSAVAIALLALVPFFLKGSKQTTVARVDEATSTPAAIGEDDDADSVAEEVAEPINQALAVDHSSAQDGSAHVEEPQKNAMVEDAKNPVSEDEQELIAQLLDDDPAATTMVQNGQPTGDAAQPTVPVDDMRAQFGGDADPLINLDQFIPAEDGSMQSGVEMSSFSSDDSATASSENVQIASADLSEELMPQADTLPEEKQVAVAEPQAKEDTQGSVDTKDTAVKEDTATKENTATKEESAPVAKAVDVSALLTRGNNFLAAGNTAGAVKTFQEAISKNPNSLAARNALGAAYMKQGEFFKAATAYRDALKVNPNDPTALNEMGFAYIKLGRYLEAMSVSQKAVKVSPKDVRARKNLAFSYQANGKIREAIEQFREVLRLQPGDSAIKDHLDELREKAKDWNVALD